MEAHFTNRCRACLTKEDHGSLLFPLADTNIRDLFALTEIEVDPNDSFPQSLCARCYKCCVDWNHFLAVALNTDQHLKNSLTAVEQKQEMHDESSQIAEEYIDYDDTTTVINSIDVDNDMLIEETIEEVPLVHEQSSTAQADRKRERDRERDRKSYDVDRIDRLIKASQRLEAENDRLRKQLDTDERSMDNEHGLRLPLQTMEELQEVEHLMQVDPQVAKKVDKAICSEFVKMNLRNLAVDTVFDCYTVSKKHLKLGNKQNKLLAKDSVFMSRVQDLLGESRLRVHLFAVRNRLSTKKCANKMKSIKDDLHPVDVIEEADDSR